MSLVAGTGPGGTSQHDGWRNRDVGYFSLWGDYFRQPFLEWAHKVEKPHCKVLIARWQRVIRDMMYSRENQSARTEVSVASDEGGE